MEKESRTKEGEIMKSKEQIAIEYEKKPAGKIFPEAAGNIRKGICPTCEKPVGKFKDDISEREYGISGMCQKCQDSVFGTQTDEIGE